MLPRSQEKIKDEVEDMKSLPQLDGLIKKGVKGKRVLVRTDMNVPIERGKISDTTRINRIVPTLKALLEAKAKVIVLSHFGRPKGEYDPDLSLAPLTDALSDELGGTEVKFAVDCIGSEAEEAVKKLKDGEILLLENLRFHKGEKANDKKFVSELASLGDVFVNDAFSCSHREHASIVGITTKLPSYAGYSLEKEIDELCSVLENPKRPFAAIVGGAKVSTKVELLENLVKNVNFLIIGGGMANTFLYAQGVGIGKSLCEKDCKNLALKILKTAKENNCKIILPKDVVVAEDLEEYAKCKVTDSDHVPKDKMILDIGPKTIQEISNVLAGCKTVVWNGPMGAYEFRPFDVGTVNVARIIAHQTSNAGLISVAGGGDILSALFKSGLRDSFSYVSTAGGAFLEWLEGKELPGISALLKR